MFLLMYLSLYQTMFLECTNYFKHCLQRVRVSFSKSCCWYKFDCKVTSPDFFFEQDTGKAEFLSYLSFVKILKQFSAVYIIPWTPLKNQDPHFMTLIPPLIEKITWSPSSLKLKYSSIYVHPHLTINFFNKT